MSQLMSPHVTPRGKLLESNWPQAAEWEWNWTPHRRAGHVPLHSTKLMNNQLVSSQNHTDPNCVDVDILSYSFLLLRQSFQTCSKISFILPLFPPEKNFEFLCLQVLAHPFATTPHLLLQKILTRTPFFHFEPGCCCSSKCLVGATGCLDNWIW